MKICHLNHYNGGRYLINIYFQFCNNLFFNTLEIDMSKYIGLVSNKSLLKNENLIIGPYAHDC